MKTKKLGGKIVIGIILFALVLKTQQTTAFFSEDNQTKDQVDLDLSSTSPKLIDLSLTPHDPIEILNDANFDDYGFPGAGTPGDPYIIENYEIETSSDISIDVRGTTKHFVIRNCYVIALFGIYLTDVAFGTATIINNTCSNNGAYGIKLWSSSGATLTDNTCSNNNGHGISLEEYSSGATLTNNTCISNNNYGISLFASSDVTLTNNTCSKNDYGIYLGPSSIALGPSSIALDSSSGATLTNNTCSNNNRDGIYLDSSSGATLTNNTCSNNGDGISLGSSSGATLTDNTCSNNNNYGIYLDSSSGATLKGNTCSNNGDGIELSQGWGIRLEYADSCLLTYNLLQENNVHGIFLDSKSDNNIIHHNIFIDNNLEGTSQACDEGTNNTWCEEETEMGNYWNEWDSKKPYPIDGNANTNDPYPLNENLDRISYEFIIFIPSIILIASLCSIIRKRKHKGMK